MTDIFISFKNTYNNKDTVDAEYAKRIYDKFTELNYNVFMMNESLQSMGVSNYKKYIDKALDEAKCMVIIGSKKEFFESDWIRYEWDTYLSEVLAGRKEDNIFTFRAGDVSIGDLPISLRKYQSFTPDKEDGLYKFASRSLTPSDDDYDKIVDRGVYPAVFFYDDTEQQYTAAIFDLELYVEGKTIEEAYMNIGYFLERWFETALYYDIKRPEATTYAMMKEMYPDNDVLLVSVSITKRMVDSLEALKVTPNSASDSEE